MSLPPLVQHSAGTMTTALQGKRFALAGTPHDHRAQRFATAGIQELQMLCKSMKRPQLLGDAGVYLQLSVILPPVPF